MISAVIADTHALFWDLLEPGRLSVVAYQAMAEAEAAETIFVPSIVLVELRYLVEKGTITEDVFRFVINSIADPGSALATADLDFNIGKAVGNIPRASVPDMPDRIIAVTALEMALPLITRDRKIIGSGIHTIW